MTLPADKAEREAEWTRRAAAKYDELFGPPALEVDWSAPDKRIRDVTRDPMFQALEAMDDFPMDHRQRMLAAFLAGKIAAREARGEDASDERAFHDTLRDTTTAHQP